jgi:hypothetical protein
VDQRIERGFVRGRAGCAQQVACVLAVGHLQAARVAFSAGAQIVFAVRQAQAALRQLQHMPRAVFRVGHDAQGQWRSDLQPSQITQQGGQRFARHARDRGQQGRDRRQPLPLDGGDVGARGVVGGQQLQAWGCLLARVGGQFGQGALQQGGIARAQGVEAADARAVCRQLGSGLPATVDVLVEIAAGIG